MNISQRDLSKINIPPKLRAVYSRIPNIDCKQECQDSCGPWSASQTEMGLIRDVIDDDPEPGSQEQCPFLTDGGKCGIYRIRPLICRLWGVAEEMPCVFGCTPDRYLSEEEVDEMLEDLTEAWDSFWDQEERANMLEDLFEEMGEDVDRADIEHALEQEHNLGPH